jgi:hypothetical protein
MLSEFLPIIEGYKKKGKHDILDMKMQGMRYSIASQIYKKRRKEIKVSIHDYATNNLLEVYRPLLDMEAENDNMFHHSEKFQGKRGWIDYNKSEKKYSIGILIADRLLILLDATKGASEDELRRAAAKIDFALLEKTYLR